MELLALSVASDSSQSMATPLLLALIVGVPLLVVALVSAIVLGPSWSRAGRWRPGQPWRNDPMWFGDGAPADIDAVLAREVERDAAAPPAIGAHSGRAPVTGPARVAGPTVDAADGPAVDGAGLPAVDAVGVPAAEGAAVIAADGVRQPADSQRLARFEVDETQQLGGARGRW